MDNNEVLYDESSSEIALKTKKEIKKTALKNIINLLFLCIVGPIPPLMAIYYRDLIGNIYVVFFYSAPIIIAVCWGIIIHLRAIYFKTKYLTFDVIIYGDKIILPSDRLIALFSPEYIFIMLKDIDKVYWNPADKKEFIITFIQNNDLKEYAPLYLPKKIIHSPDNFFKVLNKTGTNFDNKKELEFVYFFRKYKEERKNQGVKWVLCSDNPFLKRVKINKR
jgi:hypothetical protein